MGLRTTRQLTMAQVETDLEVHSPQPSSSGILRSNSELTQGDVKLADKIFDLEQYSIELNRIRKMRSELTVTDNNTSVAKDAAKEDIVDEEYKLG